MLHLWIAGSSLWEIDEGVFDAQRRLQRVQRGRVGERVQIREHIFFYLSAKFFSNAFCEFPIWIEKKELSKNGFAARPDYLSSLNRLSFPSSIDSLTKKTYIRPRPAFLLSVTH